MDRLRLTALVCLAACGPGGSQTTAEPPVAGTDTGSTSTSTSSTSATSTSSTTTGPMTPPGPGHWRGRFYSGFGFASFEDCESGEIWLVQNLFEHCENDPMLEIDGVLEIDAPGWPGRSMFVTAIVVGPCVEGSCDEPWSSCYDFDVACMQLPGCDPFMQNCPEGQKCAPYDSGFGSDSWDDAHCVPIAPNPKQPGEPCSAPEGQTAGIDDCAAGSVCWDIDADTLVGTCVAQCVGSYKMPSCADPNTRCMITNSNALTLCLPTCHPLDLKCPPDDLCLPLAAESQFICLPDASGAEGQTFDPCENVNSCDPGLLCANPALAGECAIQAAGCCLPFCDLDMWQCPGAGQECLPWYEEDAPAGLEDLGLCGLPP